MPFPALATADDLATVLKVEPFTGLEKVQVDKLLDLASGELRSIIGHPISRMTSTVTVWADRRGQLELPAAPVVSVDEVIVEGQTLDPSSYKLRWRTLYLPVCRDDVVEVTFTHGFEEIPEDLVKWTLVLAQAMKAGVDQTDSLGLTAGVVQRSEAIDDYQVSMQSGEAAGGDGTSGMTLPQRIQEQLRAAYGGGGLIHWIEVDG